MNFKSQTSIKVYLDLKDDWKQPIFFRLHQKYQVTVVSEIFAINGIFPSCSQLFIFYLKPVIMVSSLAKFCLSSYTVDVLWGQQIKLIQVVST